MTNYLDDFLFAALLRYLCNGQVRVFMRVCEYIHFPVNLEKTFWGCTALTFLGLLIDTVNQLIYIPIEKVNRAHAMVDLILGKQKVTIHQIQKLCGFLNFLCRAIVPGRAFTRHLYAFTTLNVKGRKLKPHHHIQVNGEMKADLKVWKIFLNSPEAFSRPFMDVNQHDAQEIQWFTDASRNFKLGFGGFCGSSWMSRQWDSFTESVEPSIKYLELYAVTAVVLSWLDRFKNMRICLFCLIDSKI